jgi:penicillin-binding protein 1C
MVRFPTRKTAQILIGAALGLLFLFLLIRFTPLPDSKLHTDYSAAYLASDGSLLHIDLSPSGKVRIPIHLENVSPKLVSGLVSYEDQWFYRHVGVNPFSLGRAVFLNLVHKRIISGGSTLTLQLAKLLTPRRRTWRSKAVEIFRALQLESRYSKKEILEAYLNTAPMGGNLEGVASASLLYFGKMPQDLSWGEAALLISLPRSPTYRRPDRRPEKAREGRNRVLRRLAEHGLLDALSLKDAYEAAIPTKRLANPDRCPHLTRRLGSSNAVNGFVKTTLHLPVQEVAERALRRASGGLKALGVYNGAVIVLDNKTMDVIAYVGSPDVTDKHGGQVNGVSILRSPGSALKPFLYALALQSGRITPKDMVYDLPRDWSGYKPADFEGLPAGPLRAGDALAQSLNLPAVWLEASMRNENGGLTAWMRGTGFTTQGRDRIDPGLSLVLGAYPVSLEELATLYALLARGGLLSAPQFQPSAGVPGTILGGRRLLSPEACYLVSNMLAEVARPDLPASWEFSPDHAKVAFKTGTSFGYKDAWCGAYTPRYTVGVWLGNADARGNPALTGARAASPVAFEVMQALTATQDSWFERPATIGRRKVCRLTGRPLGPDCPSWEEDDYIPGVSHNETCPVHRKIWICKKDGVEVCLRCMTGKESEYRSKVIEVWPPEIAGFLRVRGRRFEAIPRHNPDCPNPPEKPAPRIVSPENGSLYVFSAGLPRNVQRVPLVAQASSDVKKLFWFVGGKPLGTALPDEALYWSPEPGWWDLSVVDSEGRSSAVTMHVEEKETGGSSGSE